MFVVEYSLPVRDTLPEVAPEPLAVWEENRTDLLHALLAVPFALELEPVVLHCAQVLEVEVGVRGRGRVLEDAFAFAFVLEHRPGGLDGVYCLHRTALRTQIRLDRRGSS